MVNSTRIHSNTSLPDPIRILMEEHESAYKQLMQLERSVHSMNEVGFNREAFTLLADSIRFFQNEFREHDKKEEQVLFPMLEKRQPGITMEYRNEHRELWGEFNHLLSCVHDVEDSRLRGSSRQELVETAGRIIALLRTHMSNENTFLFVKAKQLLTPDEYREISEKISTGSV